MLQADPLGGLATTLSKLQKEGEGAAIQILIRPTHQDGLRKLAQKTAKEMQLSLIFPKHYLWLSIRQKIETRRTTT